jgi:hypothetical protein
MSDGINMTGFNSTKPAGTTPWSNNEQYAQDPKPAFPAKDMSSQDGSGLGNGGK